MADPAADPDAAVTEAALSGYSPHAIHMLRTVQNNTLQLARMADQKASILMGATFVVFSVAVSRSLGGELSYPLAILAVFAFFSALCAVIAVLPRLSRSLPPGASPNKMFFSHFHDLDEEDWTRDVLGDLHTDEGVFRLMLHDIYQNGQVLQHRKYRFLSYAYRLFVVGLVVTLAAFAAEFVLAYA